MKILVYGTGAVGSYLGAALAHHDHEVTFVARPVAANILRERGLSVKHPGGSYKVQPQVVSSVRQAFLADEVYDAILLTMKSYDLADALNPLLAFCPQPPPLITLQNGIGLEEIVIEQVGPGLVVAGSLTTPVSRESPDRITVEKGDRGLGLAPTTPDQKTARWVRLFETCGIKTSGLSNHQSMKWSKALLNMIGNASAAILNRHPRVIYKYRPTFDLELEMLKEAISVMRKLKLDVVDLPGTPAKRLARSLRLVPAGMLQSVLSGMVAEGRGNKMPSFHMDVVAGRKQNEVQFHNVAVAKAGKEVGIPTPVNAAYGATLMGIVRGAVDWDVFQGNPQRLVTEVGKYR